MGARQGSQVGPWVTNGRYLFSRRLNPREFSREYKVKRLPLLEPPIPSTTRLGDDPTSVCRLGTYLSNYAVCDPYLRSWYFRVLHFTGLG